jgi:spore coat protein U-like protein
MLKKVALLALAGAALASGSAQAVTIPSNLSVTATISGSCTFTTPNAVAFGSRSSTATQFDLASVNVVANCSTGIPYTIGMNRGLLASRQMSDGGTGLLGYEIYTDAGRTTPFTAIGGGSTVAGTGSGANQNVPIYPSILSQTTPVAGSYTDTVVVTLQY